MDSAEFLDLLGNANRRRILRLLARKPCYVTEISEELGVSPKAVIDHLEKLEKAGLIESQTDERRRKYFSIARHVSLEVTVSPYEFGTRSAYPSNSRFDVTSCRQVSIELGVSRPDNGTEEPEDATEGVSVEPAGVESNGAATDRPSMTASRPEPAETETSPAAREVATLARRLRDLEELERELSLLHRWAEGRITGLRGQLADRVEVAEPRLVSELLVALAEEPQGMEELCRRLAVPPPVVEELLELLAEENIVSSGETGWQLVD